MKILLIDNYDSFTYNLVHILQKYVDDVIVVRNDNLNQITISDYDKLVISPGPGIPSEAGDLMPFLKENIHKISCLGICLGLQAIAEVYNSKLLKISKVLHGVVSEIDSFDCKESIFLNIDDPIEIGHYHSWVIDPENIAKDLIITSHSNNLIMSIKHKKYDITGIQFHPESIMTPKGEQMIKNWLRN
jgi:anthranilate synthase component 2